MKTTPLRALMLCLAVFSSAWMPAAAATFTVTVYADLSDSVPDGTCDSCSLREAIQEANALPGPDVINLPPGTYTMDIAGSDEEAGATGDLDITDDVTIIGIGTTGIESHVGRIIHVHSGNVSITGLALRQGDANNDPASGRAGGAVYNAPGSTLTLNACSMSVNQAQGGGGAIYNAGTLSLNGSTLTGNNAVGSSRGGAVYNSGSMTVTNCTLHGNSSTDGGGAIFTSASSTLRIENVTITGNASTGGVGGGGVKAESGAALYVANSLIADNTASGPNDDCEGTLVSTGGNVVKDADGCTGLGLDDTIADPVLGPLQDNGGRTKTRAPQPGSPALDTGGATLPCEDTDQRRLPRPQSASCDRGAVEIFPGCPAIAMTPVDLPDGQAGVLYTQTIAPSGGVPPYRFAVTGGTLPAGLALNPVSGELAGVPTGTDGSFVVTAFDANLCPGTLSDSISVQSGPSCSPTEIDLSPVQLPMATPGDVYAQTLLASGGVAPHLYTVTEGYLPPGLTLDPVTGALGGTPSVSGTFVFVGTATDANTCTGSQGYALQVLCSLQFDPLALPVAKEGTSYLQPLAVSTGGTPPYAFATVSGTVPPGLTLSGPGVLTGTPTAPGTYAFLVEATDDNFCTGKVGYVLSVDPCLVFPAVTLPSGVVGTPFAAVLTASGGAGAATFSISAGTPPPGVDLDGSGNFTGTPTTPGAYTFTVEATNGDCSVSREVFILINPAGCSAIGITPATLPGGTVGDAVSQNLDGTGGSGPFSFSVVSGVLPDGLFLSAGGHLSGTLLSSGRFEFTIAATDSGQCTGAVAYTMLVAPSVCPQITVFPPALPPGTRGIDYLQMLLATGGIGPYTWSLTAGTLPPGLLLDPAAATISGVPTDLGSWPVTLTATDATSCVGTLVTTLEVGPDLRGANCTWFGDTFENSLVATDWTVVKPSWSESGGNLVGVSGKKAVTVASPAFAGCLDCTVEATVQTSKPSGKVSLLGWYVDKANTMELSASAGSDAWMLTEKYKGTVVAKVKATRPMEVDTPYAVRIAFDGSVFQVFVDDMETPLMSLTPKRPVTAGTVGFQAAGTTGSFGFVCVN